MGAAFEALKARQGAVVVPPAERPKKKGFIRKVGDFLAPTTTGLLTGDKPVNAKTILGAGLEVGSFALPTGAILKGLGLAGKGAILAAKGAKAASTAQKLTNFGTKMALRAKQGAVIGGSAGTMFGAGRALGEEGATLKDVAGEAAISGVVGAAGGAILEPAIGLATMGAKSAVNLVAPQMRRSYRLMNPQSKAVALDEAVKSVKMSFIENKPAAIKAFDELMVKSRRTKGPDTADGLIREALEDGYLPMMDGEVANMRPHIDNIADRRGSIANKLDQYLEPIKTKIPLRAYATRVEKELSEDFAIDERAVNQFHRIFKSIRNKYGKTITTKDLNSVVKELNQLTKSFDDEKFKADMAIIAAREAGKMIGEIAQNNVVTAMKSEMHRLFRVEETLRALHGKKADVGWLARSAGNYLGTISLAAAGGGFLAGGPGGLVVAGIAAHLGGKGLASMIRQMRFNPQIMKMLKSTVGRDQKLKQKLLQQTTGADRALLTKIFTQSSDQLRKPALTSSKAAQSMGGRRLDLRASASQNSRLSFFAKKASNQITATPPISAPKNKNANIDIGGMLPSRPQVVKSKVKLGTQRQKLVPKGAGEAATPETAATKIYRGVPKGKNPLEVAGVFTKGLSAVDDVKVAHKYANMRGGGGDVYELKLKPNAKIKDVDVKDVIKKQDQYKKEGVDVIRFTFKKGDTAKEMVVLNPKAVISANKIATQHPEALGAFAGIDLDEDGKPTFKPERALLGFGLMTAIKRGNFGGMPEFKGLKNLSTKLIEKFRGMPNIISRQRFNEVLNRAKKEGLKEADENLIKGIVEKQGDQINLTAVANEAQAQLVPLKPTQVKTPRWSGVGEDFIGDGKYQEIVYESPIKTSAGDVHYGYGAPVRSRTDVRESFPNYFSHVRYEDKGNVRKLLEVQSDLTQKGNLEREADFQFGGGTLRAGTQEHADIARQKISEKAGVAVEQRTKELQQLQPYAKDTAAHLRTFREEVGRAARDNKITMLTPDGKTAMKIEGLGDTQRWHYVDPKLGQQQLTIDALKIGRMIEPMEGASWIITDLLDGHNIPTHQNYGKFKAVPKASVSDDNGNVLEKFIKRAKENGHDETFDISGKVDAQHFVYKLNESAIPKEARRLGLQVEKVTGIDNGDWWQIQIPKERAKMPIEAFGFGAIPAAGAVFGRKKEER